MLEWIYSPEAWIALGTLTALEIVLGIDNIIFISILVGRLPPAQRNSARVLGLGLAMISRILLLLSLAWIARLTTPLFEITQFEISGRDLVLIGGGLFLLVKATKEIHAAVEGDDDEGPHVRHANYWGTLVQIAIIDIVFSLDSVITAVGMANDIPVMVIAIIVAVLVMMLAAKAIGEFVEKHPTIKVLALSFLIMVGIALVAEGLDFKIPKPYIYFAMAFSVTVEMINIRLRKKIDTKPKM